MSSTDTFYPLLSAVALIEDTGGKLLGISKDLKDIFDKVSTCNGVGKLGARVPSFDKPLICRYINPCCTGSSVCT